MELYEKNAVKLIQEISEIVDYDINIMNKKGIIIASTNSSRVGNFHEGAFKILSENLSELIIQNESQFKGSKQGINLPIILNSTMVGVIGITGELNEVTKYVKLIKKITEILTLDLINLQEKSRQEHSKIIFLNNWINGMMEDLDELKSKLELFHLSIKKPLCVTVIKILNNTVDINALLSKNLSSQNLLYHFNDDTGIVIGNFNTEKSCVNFFEGLVNNCNLSSNLKIAVGSVYSDCLLIKKSYKEALKLLSVGFGNDFIAAYSEHLAKIALNDIPDSYKEKCFTVVYSNLSPKDITEFSNFILVYFENNGSINAIARLLFLHKNTVQYKINKIYEKTGLDLRKYNDLLSLYLTALWNTQNTRSTFN